ncbi:hypothetical protein BKE38_00075 [Pseudoroseomonas deserti]|uniref:Uncharacterized protein n=1 Tax=Teichococcus deserti TaxID=1817963 RepID=A0A1V2H8M9_9PROT|nr:hypothetical protein [Pseudoroseomonas deserti]ONG59112.1 hypothetical protein BKE38_00075 [Pseudoroseomonas deserti]
MEAAAHRQRRDDEALGSQRRRQTGQPRLRQGEDAMLRAVDGGELGICRGDGGQRHDARSRRQHRQHRRRGQQRLEAARILDNQGEGVFQGEHAGDGGGDGLAQAVAQQQVGADAAGEEALRQAPDDGQQRRRALDLPVEASAFGHRAAIDDLAQAAALDRAGGLVATRQAGAEDGVLRMELAAHLVVLRALAGESVTVRAAPGGIAVAPAAMIVAPMAVTPPRAVVPRLSESRARQEASRPC